MVAGGGHLAETTSRRGAGIGSIYETTHKRAGTKVTISLYPKSNTSVGPDDLLTITLKYERDERNNYDSNALVREPDKLD